MVVKIDDFETQRALGVVGREPRWAIAFKFAPTTAVTKLREDRRERRADRQHGARSRCSSRSQVGGVTVGKATLHNEEDIARKDIREGDQVVVMRAGDVIPQVVSPVTQRRDGQGAALRAAQRSARRAARKTVKPEGEVWTRCPNRNDCPGQILQALKHFVSRGAMDIEGFGEKLVLALLRGGARARRCPTSTTSRSSGWSRWRASSAGRPRTSSRRSSARSSQPFHRVLYALGIPGIGGVNARALAAHFGSIDRADGARRRRRSRRSRASARCWPATIGETLDEQRNRQLIERAARRRAAVWRRSGRPATARCPLAGKTFVLTGTLEGMTPRGGDRADRGARAAR